mgnify:CR=1 FL=1
MNVMELVMEELVDEYSNRYRNALDALQLVDKLRTAALFDDSEDPIAKSALARISYRLRKRAEALVW